MLLLLVRVVEPSLLRLWWNLVVWYVSTIGQLMLRIAQRIVLRADLLNTGLFLEVYLVWRRLLWSLFVANSATGVKRNGAFDFFILIASRLLLTQVPLLMSEISLHPLLLSELISIVLLFDLILQHSLVPLLLQRIVLADLSTCLLRIADHFAVDLAHL